MSELGVHKSFEIQDRSGVGECRRYAAQVAQWLGFDEGRRSDVGIVTTEMATNVLMHAGQGEMVVCPRAYDRAVWLDLMALDKGPGVRNVARAWEDGYSTAGTAGQGLGSVQRQSDASALYSLPERGTALWSRFVLGGQALAELPGVINVAVRGEALPGDCYFYRLDAMRSRYMVVDGLGHGTGAREAAQAASDVVREHVGAPLVEVLGMAHDALRSTRGAAMTLVEVDYERRLVTSAGAGNISASIVVPGAPSRNLVSQNGTLGAVVPRLQEYTYPLAKNATLVMFSDGLGSKCSLGSYAGLANRPTALIAAVLYRDFVRKRDDATILVDKLEKM